MAVFLRLEDPNSQSSFIDLNVVSFKEERVWKGNDRPAFDNTMLSTKHDVRKVFTCRVEFSEPIKLNAFDAFIASGTEVLTGRPTGIRPLNMTYTGVALNGSLRGIKARMLVNLDIGPIEVSSEETQAGVLVPIWAMDLTLREV
jgi:hypothetical protein